jgi:Flp pilus assembly protein TadB
MNVKIGDLTASDFPGIDEAKFNEWKALKIKKNRELRIVFYIGVGILFILSVVSVLTANLIFLLIFLILLIIDDLIFIFIFFYRRRYRHLLQLGEELKMSARLRAKKKGQAFTG